MFKNIFSIFNVSQKPYRHNYITLKEDRQGNFVMITALLIPVIIMAMGATIDVGRMSYYRYLMQLASDEALHDGIDTLAYKDGYSGVTIKDFIRKDLQARLIANDFNAKEAATIANRAELTIDIQDSFDGLKTYSGLLVSIYDMPLIPPSGIFFSKFDWTTLRTESRYKAAINRPSIIIMANPQAWRLSDKQNSNAINQAPWEDLNKKVVKSLNTLARQKNIAFAIINGKLTDGAKEDTRHSFYRIYDQLSFPYYVGLGARDFRENLPVKEKGHVFTMIKDLTSKINAEYSKLPSFNMAKSREGIDVTILDKKGVAVKKIEEESHFRSTLGYSWDFGDLHFAQLHNHPFFDSKIKLLKKGEIIIEPTISVEYNHLSLKFQGHLRTKALQRKKHIILTFYDADSRLTPEKKEKLRGFIKEYRISAIFAGSAHKIQEKKYVGDNPQLPYGHGVTVYNAGAAYKGDYLLLERVGSKTLKVTAYNGRSGTPEIVQEMSPIHLQ